MKVGKSVDFKLISEHIGLVKYKNMIKYLNEFDGEYEFNFKSMKVKIKIIETIENEYIKVKITDLKDLDITDIQDCIKYFYFELVYYRTNTENIKEIEDKINTYVRSL